MEKNKLKTAAGCRELLREYGSLRGIAKGVGISSHQYVGRQLAKFGIKAGSPIPIILDKKETYFDWKEFLLANDAVNKLEEAASVSQDSGTVLIPTDKPIGIIPTGDWHIGGVMDIEAFINFIQLVKEKPYLFVVGVGDFINNFIKPKHLDGIMFSSISPDSQIRVLKSVIETLGDKLLAIEPGNHENFTLQQAGIRLENFVVGGKPIVLRAGAGNLFVRVGSEDDYVEYKIRLRHKGRFNSSLNLTNSVKRMRQKEEDCDIGVIAHHHEPAVEELEEAGKPFLAIRTGTFQIKNDWGRMLGYGDGILALPVIILYPGKKRFLGYLQIRDAVEFLDLVWEV